MRRGRPKKNPFDGNQEKIEKLAKQGKSNRQIAKELGISESTFYANMDAKTNDTLKKGRKEIIEKLENTMLRSAYGFTKTVTKHAKLKRVEYEECKKVREWEDVVEYEEDIYFKPDVTAGIFMLKNWGGYANEPEALKLREVELKIQQQRADNAEW